MKALRFSLAVILLLTMAGICAAQVDMDQPPQDSRAMVQPGPVVQANLPPSADVYVDGRWALRIPASAGGLNPMQRAEMIANRLNEAFEAGETWQNTFVSQVEGLWVVSLNGRLIATADVNSARAFGIPTSQLANRWANQTVVAMGGQPAMIAQQLQPIPGRVAGVVEEIPMAWTVTPSRTVPLLNAATGERIGDVMVGGATAQLNTVGAVAMYEHSADDAVIISFVPITGTAITESPSRVQGVGVVGMPTGMVPTAGLRMGTDLQTSLTQMSVQWNTMINTRLRQQNLQLGAPTRIVPLYSMDQNQIIGAAQIVGTAASVAQAQAVVLNMQNGTARFSATTSAAPFTAMPTAQRDVVISALIYMPADEALPPMLPEESPAATPPTTPPGPPTEAIPETDDELLPPGTPTP